MTEASAGKIANIVIGAAVLGAAYVVVKTPRLRQLAWRLAVNALTVSGPAWVSREIQQGWNESGRRQA
ncbi:MAG: hypothetical protein ABI818_10845 [Acidobacteriota bacterium]